MLDLAVAYRIYPHVSREFRASGKDNCERRIGNKDGDAWMTITEKRDLFNFRLEKILFMRLGGGPR